MGGDYKQDEIYEQKAEIKRFIDSPFLGTGLGSKNEFEVLRPYLEEEGLFYYVDYDEDKEVSRLNLYTQEEQFTTTSFYTGIAVQLGIYGLILLLFVIVYTWFALTKAEKISKSIENNWLYNLTLGLKASFLGQIIYLARGNPTFKLFWLMVGVSLALSFLLKTKYNSEILNLLKIKTE